MLLVLRLVVEKVGHNFLVFLSKIKKELVQGIWINTDLELCISKIRITLESVSM
jgi:hypothetical protein